MVEQRRHGKDDGTVEIRSVRKTDSNDVVATVEWYGKRGHRLRDVLIPPPASLTANSVEIPAPANRSGGLLPLLADIPLKTIVNGGGDPNTRSLVKRYGIQVLPPRTIKANSPKSDVQMLTEEIMERAPAKQPIHSVHLAQGAIVELERKVIEGSLEISKTMVGVIRHIGPVVDIIVPPLHFLRVDIEKFRHPKEPESEIPVPGCGRFKVARITQDPGLDLVEYNVASLDKPFKRSVLDKLRLLLPLGKL